MPISILNSWITDHDMVPDTPMSFYRCYSNGGLGSNVVERIWVMQALESRSWSTVSRVNSSPRGTWLPALCGWRAVAIP